MKIEIKNELKEIKKIIGDLRINIIKLGEKPKWKINISRKN